MLEVEAIAVLGWASSMDGRLPILEVSIGRLWFRLQWAHAGETLLRHLVAADILNTMHSLRRSLCLCL